jgi:hypothetical protein
MFSFKKSYQEKFTESFNRISLIVLFFILCVLMLLVVSDDSDAFVVDGNYYRIIEGSDNEVTISKCYNVGDYVMPSTVTYEGVTYKITRIGINAFEDSTLTSIVIPEGVTKIESFAFDNSHLQSVVIPNSVTNLEKCAFAGCQWLRNVTLPISLDAAKGDSTPFNNCVNIRNITFTPGTGVGVDYKKDYHPFQDSFYFLYNVVFEEGIKYIGDYTLFGFNHILSISIPNSIEGIGDHAFHDCVWLRELKIPISFDAASSALTYIWENCANLQKVTFTRGTGIGYDYGTAFSS